MIVKCPCQHCDTNIEFDVEAANTFVACPACGKQTRLLMPPNTKSATKPRENFIKSELELWRPTLKKSFVEEQLDGIARFFLWSGIIGLIICFIIMAAAIVEAESGGFTAFLVGIGLFIQGYIFFVLFRAAAEAIRLLRVIGETRKEKQ
jgi:hypothetical protein